MMDTVTASVDQMEDDFQAVISNELTLLEVNIRRDGTSSQALLHDNFREFGASGRVWDRQSILQAMARDSRERIVAEDIRPVRLGPDTVMLTYTARRAGEASLRTSVWVRVDSGWRLLHHQGTRLPNGH